MTFSANVCIDEEELAFAGDGKGDGDGDGDKDYLGVEDLPRPDSRASTETDAAVEMRRRQEQELLESWGHEVCVAGDGRGDGWRSWNRRWRRAACVVAVAAWDSRAV